MAIEVVERGLLAAEEMYLVKPGATLGIWFARVQETLCVANIVTVARLDEGRSLSEADTAGEQLGVLAAISAESIRAAGQVWPAGPYPQARAEAMEYLVQRVPPAAVGELDDVLVVLGRCSAALEPLANGLREGDLPIGEPTDGSLVCKCFLTVAAHAFGAIHALC